MRPLRHVLRHTEGQWRTVAASGESRPLEGDVVPWRGDSGDVSGVPRNCALMRVSAARNSLSRLGVKTWVHAPMPVQRHRSSASRSREGLSDSEGSRETARPVVDVADRKRILRPGSEVDTVDPLGLGVQLRHGIALEGSGGDVAASSASGSGADGQGFSRRTGRREIAYIATERDTSRCSDIPAEDWPARCRQQQSS